MITKDNSETLRISIAKLLNVYPGDIKVTSYYCGILIGYQGIIPISYYHEDDAELMIHENTFDNVLTVDCKQQLEKLCFHFCDEANKQMLEYTNSDSLDEKFWTEALSSIKNRIDYLKANKQMLESTIDSFYRDKEIDKLMYTRGKIIAKIDDIALRKEIAK